MPEKDWTDAFAEDRKYDVEEKPDTKKKDKVDWSRSEEEIAPPPAKKAPAKKTPPKKVQESSSELSS